MAVVRQKIQPQFTEVSPSVHLAWISAKYDGSMALLKQNGLRPLNYREALLLIDGNPNLKEQLKNNWFYLSGKGPEESGHYYFDTHNLIRRGKGDLERTFYIKSGKDQLSMFVLEDVYAHVNRTRFNFSSLGVFRNDAPVVMGVKIRRELHELKLLMELTPVPTMTFDYADQAITKLKRGDDINKIEFAALCELVEAVRRQQHEQ